MRKTMWRLLRDRRGATAIEYGLIAAIVAVGIIASLQVFRDGLYGLYQKIDTEFTKASGG